MAQRNQPSQTGSTNSRKSSKRGTVAVGSPSDSAFQSMTGDSLVNEVVGSAHMSTGLHELGNDINVWLDDKRPAPPGYLHVKTARTCIATLDLLRRPGHRIAHLSLDHDLGDDAGNGYEVVTWVEGMVFTEGYVPPIKMTVHSDNAGARKKMLLGIESTQRRFREHLKTTLLDIVKTTNVKLMPTKACWATADATGALPSECRRAMEELIDENKLTAGIHNHLILGDNQ